jgi:nucleoside-diphosphate-sugar epimerase
VRFNLEQMMRGIDHGYYFHIAGVDPKRSFLSVENVARALVHLTRNDVPDGIYNLADPHPYSLAGFGNELADRMGQGRPRTVPYSLVQLAGAVGTVIQKLGVHPPISTEILAKLSSSLMISTLRLAQTGFEWDENAGAVLQEMANHYRNSTCNSKVCTALVN